MKDELIERLKARKQIPISIASRAGLESPTDPLCLEAAQQGEADNARIAEILEAFQDVADIVAVYAQQPVEKTRQRHPLAQATWDQLAQIVGEKYQAARSLTQEATNAE